MWCCATETLKKGLSQHPHTKSACESVRMVFSAPILLRGELTTAYQTKFSRSSAKWRKGWRTDEVEVTHISKDTGLPRKQIGGVFDSLAA
jgi:hypothetical protein